jgi:hypothetical protein
MALITGEDPRSDFRNPIGLLTDSFASKSVVNVV